MSKWKKIAKRVGVVAVIGAAVAGVWASRTFDTSRSDVADKTEVLSRFKSTDAAAIKHGEYVMRMADCAACHTAGNGDFAGGYKIDTPFGALVSSNITPDAETGIGNMTERDFFNAVRQGIGSHGLLYPAMPYTAYVQMSDKDMHDLWEYMSTLTPVRHEVHENAAMPFPFNVRLAMAGWDMLFFENKGFDQEASRDAEWSRGKYLVQGAGHCSTCHTPRNFLGGEKLSEFLHGSDLGGWASPDITSNKEMGAGWMTSGQMVEYLKTGSTEGTVASGPMAEAIENSFQYLDDTDLKAIAKYVLSLPPSDLEPDPGFKFSAAKEQQEYHNYEVNCSACHGVNGEGIKGMVPAIAGNNRITTRYYTNLVHAMLMGTRAAHTQTLQTAAGMPSFAWKMNDQQIADILTYVRNAFGNKGSQVQVQDVAKMRKELGARQKVTDVQH